MSDSKVVSKHNTKGFLWFSPEFLMRKTHFSQFLRKFRRFYLGVFNKEYVEQSVASERKGECHRCGLCCELIYKCPFLGKDSQKQSYCRIYGDLRPGSCRNYPFDKVDSEVEQCGFKFDQKK